MVLPQKAIEQLGREPAKTPGWSPRILMLSSIIFFLSISIYFGLRFGYQPYLDKKLAGIKDQINAFGQKIPFSEQQKIVNFYSQLTNLETLLMKQRVASAALPWLESHTQANVAFSDFSVDFERGVLSVSALARSIDDVAQQLVSLENTPEVARVEFTGTSVDEEGLWGFSLALTVVPEFFLNPEKFLTPPSE